MPGDVYKKFIKIEKDYNVASKGRAISAPMKKARNALDIFKKVAFRIDQYNDLMSAEISKASTKIGAGLGAAMEHIKAADTAYKKCARDIGLLGQLQKQIAKIATKDMKTSAPVEYRALKVLSADMLAFDGYATYLMKDRKEQILNIGKVFSAAERKQKVHDKAMLQLSKAVKRARSAIQKIKATPTEKTWSDQFKFAGRDIKMALVSLKKAHDGGGFLEWDPVVTKKYYEASLVWDTQKKMSTMESGASKKEILDRLKSFSFMVKNIASHYQIT